MRDVFFEMILVRSCLFKFFYNFFFRLYVLIVGVCGGYFGGLKFYFESEERFFKLVGFFGIVRVENYVFFIF